MADEKKGKAPKAKTAPQGGGAEKKSRKASTGLSGPVESGKPTGPKGKPRMRVHYEDVVRPQLVDKFKYTSVMQAPKVTKIVINMGVGDAIADQKLMEAAVNELAQIAGQKPAVRRAKKAISNFKLRAGLPIGAAVTLRGARMY